MQIVDCTQSYFSATDVRYNCHIAWMYSTMSYMVKYHYYVYMQYVYKSGINGKII